MGQGWVEVGVGVCVWVRVGVENWVMVGRVGEVERGGGHGGVGG